MHDHDRSTLDLLSLQFLKRDSEGVKASNRIRRLLEKLSIDGRISSRMIGWGHFRTGDRFPALIARSHSIGFGGLLPLIGGSHHSGRELVGLDFVSLSDNIGISKDRSR